MDIAAVALYTAPILFRFALADEYTVGRIVLSLFPILIVLPSIYLPEYVQDEKREHIYRHMLYALAFTVSAITCIRWDVVHDSVDTRWAKSLILYFATGIVSLWWFVVSHITENTVVKDLYTHQGDVAILPLTLVAIATFVEDVPDEAFQFSRCVSFYVPIIVAWATIHFIAYTQFALSTNTTYSMDGFHFVASMGLVIASCHLSLIEMRAPPSSFILFSIVAATLSQVTHRYWERAVLRQCRIMGMLVLQAGGTALFATLIHIRFKNTLSVVIPILTVCVCVVAIPTLCGNRWVVPSTFYSFLITISFLNSLDEEEVRVWDAIMILCGFYLTFWITNHIAPPEEEQITHPLSFRGSVERYSSIFKGIHRCEHIVMDVFISAKNTCLQQAQTRR